MKDRTMATKAIGETCDNCMPVWDRTGNVKTMQLCSLHSSSETLLEACKFALDTLKIHYPKGHFVTKDKLKLAISKAEGELLVEYLPFL